MSASAYCAHGTLPQADDVESAADTAAADTTAAPGAARWWRGRRMLAAASCAACLLLAACCVAGYRPSTWPRRAQDGAASQQQPAPVRLDSVGGEGKWQLRSIGSGCTNWALAMLGEMSIESDPHACGRRCAQTEGCLGFGYQHGASPDWQYGKNHSGGCAMWKMPCVDMENQYWDDYEMTELATSFPSTTSAILTEEEKLLTQVSMGSIRLENLDLRKLRGKHEMYKRFVLSLKRELATKMGVSPKDVKLDIQEGPLQMRE